MLEVKEYLHNNIIPPLNHKLLLHIDEHNKMCEHEGDAVIKGALFSRVAMTALAKVPRTTVIATFTKMPPLPLEGSSEACCHFPVAKPCLHAVAEDIEELRFPYSQDSFSWEQKRLWVTLCFCSTSRPPRAAAGVQK